jgi:hypothetical protein
VPTFEVPTSLAEEETLKDGDGAGLGLGLRLPLRDASLLNLDPDKKQEKQCCIINLYLNVQHHESRIH